MRRNKSVSLPDERRAVVQSQTPQFSDLLQVGQSGKTVRQTYISRRFWLSIGNQEQIKRAIGNADRSRLFFSVTAGTTFPNQERAKVGSTSIPSLTTWQA